MSQFGEWRVIKPKKKIFLKFERKCNTYTQHLQYKHIACNIQVKNVKLFGQKRNKVNSFGVRNKYHRSDGQMVFLIFYIDYNDNIFVENICGGDMIIIILASDDVLCVY